MKIRIRTALVVLGSYLSLQGMAQQSVSIGIKQSDSCAALDIMAANKGLLIPRVSLSGINDVTTIANPKQSLLVYNTSAAITGGNGVGFYYWDGTSKWVPIANYEAGWLLTGNGNAVPGNSFLGTVNNASLRMKTNNAERMVVDSVGNVGIGLTNLSLTAPRVRLQVDSSVLFGKDTAFTGDVANMFYWNASKGALRGGTIASKNWDTDSIGNNSIALGSDPKATGLGAVALGVLTKASGDYSFAHGYVSEALGMGSIAIGRSSTASEDGSLAIGTVCKATDIAAIAIGSGAVAEGENAVAIGTNVRVSNQGAIGLGSFLAVNGQGSMALGRNDTIMGLDAITLGRYNYAEDFGTVIGSYSRAINQGAMILSDNSGLSGDARLLIESTEDNQFTGAFNGGYRFLLNRGDVTKGTFITPFGSVGIGTNTPATTLQVMGSVSANIRTLSSTTTLYPVVDDDYFIVIPVNASITIYMPEAASSPGRMLYIQCINPGLSGGSAGIAKISVASSEGNDYFSLPSTITDIMPTPDGIVRAFFTSGAAYLKFISNGTYWMVSQ